MDIKTDKWTKRNCLLEKLEMQADKTARYNRLFSSLYKLVFMNIRLSYVLYNLGIRFKQHNFVHALKLVKVKAQVNAVFLVSKCKSMYK